MTQHEIVRQTLSYWVEVHMPDLDPPSAAVGLRYGMIIALAYPDYARAYAAATHRPEADRFQDEAMKEFIAAVPMMAGEEGADAALN
ncbi:hypothetical protein LCGC14_1645950 [marine sediment metagenome]|uniref:Uncharacterized protein n=2 Tax=marine sediment metagenome TaxID=412755 RepID=A0A0F9KY57_9ZZZZ